MQIKLYMHLSLDQIEWPYDIQKLDLEVAEEETVTTYIFYYSSPPKW